MRWIALVTHALGWAISSLWSAARRWPALAVIVAAIFVLLWPLWVDLFYVIPPPVRKAGGWVVVIGFVVACLERLWRVLPGDDAPPPDQTPDFDWACLIPLLACAVMAVPYLRGS